MLYKRYKTAKIKKYKHEHVLAYTFNLSSVARINLQTLSCDLDNMQIGAVLCANIIMLISRKRLPKNRFFGMLSGSCAPNVVKIGLKMRTVLSIDAGQTDTGCAQQGNFKFCPML